MNKERLRKLAQRLDKTKPERFDMSSWCGTACCIGGHTLIMARRPRKNLDWWQDWFAYGRPCARRYLGLEEGTACDLMDVSKDNCDATPKQAAKVIRHLIKHGVVDWERFVK